MQPPSSPKKMASEGLSTNYIEKAADAPCFEMEESTLGTSELLTMELQEAAKLDEEVQQLADESLILKESLDFATERLEGHVKSTRVEGEALKVIASSLEADKNPLRVSTCMPSIGTSAEVATMLSQLHRIAIIEQYNELGEQGSVQKLWLLWVTTTATGVTMTQATMTMTRLDADQQLHKATKAIQWRRSAMDMDAELDSLRADRYLRQSAIVAWESMTDHE
ncbi:hypothetical protein BKA82DRAFT_4018772 [Pisolithus tinctorius]|nr:hypothetical protein BKA82DRAFT_4018772 [Pisolithus tinctorius]